MLTIRVTKINQGIKFMSTIILVMDEIDHRSFENFRLICGFIMKSMKSVDLPTKNRRFKFYERKMKVQV